MTQSKKTFKDLFLEQVAHKEAALTEHPDVGRLADYLDDLLTAPKMEEIRDHLAVCSLCRKELRLLDAPMEGMDEFGVQSGEERARKWTEFQAVRANYRPIPFYLRLGFAYGLAAILLVGIVGLVLFKSPGGVIPNADQAYLSPVPRGPSREANSIQEIVLSKNSPGLFLTLNLTNMDPFPAYGLEVYDDPRPQLPRQRITGLVRKQGGNFTVLLSRNLVEEGVFWFILIGKEKSEKEELAAYRVKVQKP